MSETLTFHFEGALADSHQMNFYESARFQYAAARLLVKLAQFRNHGRFVKKITNNSNIDIKLTAQSAGSFNINAEDSGEDTEPEPFVKIPLSVLLAFVSERLIEKIDEDELRDAGGRHHRRLSSGHVEEPDYLELTEKFVGSAMADMSLLEDVPIEFQEVVKRRIAEILRERRLLANQAAISRIDIARGEKLIAMSAPLISEMATALRSSADTLEITSSIDGDSKPILFLDRSMAEEIETAVVDEDITPILGDIIQFNKNNGWRKVKIENNRKILSFSISYDILPSIRQRLISHMQEDLVYLQTYFVRDRSGDVTRLIVVGILETPS